MGADLRMKNGADSLLRRPAPISFDRGIARRSPGAFACRSPQHRLPFNGGLRRAVRRCLACRSPGAAPGRSPQHRLPFTGAFAGRSPLHRLPFDSGNVWPETDGASLRAFGANLGKTPIYQRIVDHEQYLERISLHRTNPWRPNGTPTSR